MEVKLLSLLFCAALARAGGHTVNLTGAQYIAQRTNAFALDMFNAVSALPESEGQNIFLSPFSVMNALSMVLDGAAHDTEDQMLKTMHLEGTPLRKILSGINDLDEVLNSKDSQFSLDVANNIYIQQGYHFLESFIKDIKTFFSIEPEISDFAKNSEPERQHINDWVAKQTNEKIKDLIPPKGINALTKMVVVNAIYFNGTWATQFNPNFTQKVKFQTKANQSKDIDIMHIKSDFKYGYANKIKSRVLEMPYAGNDLSMYVLLPDSPDGFKLTQSGLTFNDLQMLDKHLMNQTVRLSFPKFNMTKAIDLGKQVLPGMGMSDLFDPTKADLSNMDGTKNLVLGNLYHKGYIAVDESGTEAAAASGGGSNAMAPPEFSVTKPFHFFIKDKRTNVILFIGRIIDPAADNTD